MSVLHISSNDFAATIAEGVTLVDFFAQWCGPCKMLAPILDKVADELDGRAKVAKVDIDEAMDLASRYGVQSIPTLIVFKDGEIVSQTLGAQSKNALLAMVEKAL